MASSKRDFERFVVWLHQPENLAHADVRRLANLILANCLVSCDHIPRRSMALFRAKAVLDELIAGLPARASHQLQQIA